ncbi:MAG: hypothetical protein FJ368_00705 [Pelagibacterales bacterium]|nr:hypothetical protein [Pelagibacterales bacterium]
MRKNNFDIIIIGGSFAGMTSALALSNVSHNLKIAVIEKQDITKEDRKADGRAYAISAASLKLFKEIGIYNDLKAKAGKIADIKITDYKSPFFLDFLGQEVDEKEGQLGQIIENYHIHNALRNKLITRENITLFCPNFYEEITFGEFINHSCYSEHSTCHPEHSEGSRNDGVCDMRSFACAQDDKSGAQNDKSGAQDDKSSFQDDKKREDHYEGEGNVLVKLDDGKILKSKLLLACDGRFSKLREIYQIPTAQKKYHQTAIVFNVKHEKSHENVAYEKFLPGGPLAILPMQNEYQSSIVWIAKDDDAQAILSLDEENFAHQLKKKMENSLGDIQVISQKFSYPLILVEARKFYHEKMLLIGDASAGVHPIAGQGFNLAISGINILCNLIKNALFCGQDISSKTVIEEYNKQAKLGAKKMIIATDILNSIFETKSLSIALARDVGLGLVNKISFLKKFFIKSAGGF